MLSEILEIPVKARYFLENAPAYTLPTRVPYLGMGSSYFAPLAFKYMGIDILPEMASEYYNYVFNDKKRPLAVILSQSGRSSEALWCTELFEEYTAISNDIHSPLCTQRSVNRIVSLLADDEKYSSSKTYTNTLLALFKGFGFDPSDAVRLLNDKMSEYDKKGQELATAVFNLYNDRKINGIYITGSGPNIATACQAALILSESTKLNFVGLPLAQYDHGPKEAARNSIMINVIAGGRSYERTVKLGITVKAAGAHLFTVEEPGVSENQSILNNIIPFNFMAFHLSQKLDVKETFVVGGKVTEVDEAF